VSLIINTTHVVLTGDEYWIITGGYGLMSLC
jgi:hypothetical protein